MDEIHQPFLASPFIVGTFSHANHQPDPPTVHPYHRSWASGTLGKEDEGPRERQVHLRHVPGLVHACRMHGRWSDFDGHDLVQWNSLSIYPSIHPSIHLSIYLSIYPSIHLSIHPSIHLPIHLSIDLCIYVYIYLLQEAQMPTSSAGFSAFKWIRR